MAPGKSGLHVRGEGVRVISIPSPSAGDLRELPRVPLRGEGSCGYWNELPFPSPGDLPDPGIKRLSLMSPAWAVGSLPLVPPGKPS